MAEWALLLANVVAPAVGCARVGKVDYGIFKVVLEQAVPGIETNPVCSAQYRPGYLLTFE